MMLIGNEADEEVGVQASASGTIRTP